MRYFDHNATHPLLPVAREAWLTALERYPGNPSSPHRLGNRSDQALEQARHQVAAHLGCRPGEITFTSGATESNNAIIRHLQLATEGNIWVSSIEHPSMHLSARRSLGSRIRPIPVTHEGRVDLDTWLPQVERDRPGAVILMAANNETGVLQPTAEVLTWCRDRGIPFVCDAAQWIGRLPATGLGEATYVSGCAHKFGGPPGVGFLKAPTDIQPWMLGGSQEDGRRAGTENLPGILAMLAAWNYTEEQLSQEAHQIRIGWRTRFELALNERLPEVEILGKQSGRLWNTVAALLPTPDCRFRWVVRLDRLGFAVSTGSACSSGQEKPSQVLLAMGRSPEQAGRMIRFSSGWTTQESDWQALLEAICGEARKVFSKAFEKQPD